MDLTHRQMARLARTLAFGLAATIVAGTAYAQLGFGSTVDLSTLTREALLPGGEVQAHLDGPFGFPVGSADKSEQLMLATRGFNYFSNHAPGVSSGFASALAQADGNGAVGVANYEFGGETSGGGPAVRQLVAQATWAQTFANNGTIDLALSLHLHIPALEVQLHGISPMRSTPSQAETAEATASVAWVVTHADGSFTNGSGWKFGLREFEDQVFLSFNTYANFGDLQTIMEGSAGPLLFVNLTQHDPFPDDRSFTSDAVSTAVSLGTLKPGDSVRYIYQLTAQGTTNGLERGFGAFIGDPFNLSAIGDNLQLTAAPAVPEPGGAALLAAGLAGMVMLARRRRVPGAGR